MKTFLLFVFFGLFSFNEGSSLYKISFESFNSSTIDMSFFKGKRLVIVAFDSKRPNAEYLTFIDSVVKSCSASTAVIVVPATDLSEDGTDSSTGSESFLSRLLKRDIIVSKAMPVKKSSGSLQHPLFKWLTSVGENGHFDRDVEQDGQLFIINEQGVLYGVHGKQFSVTTIKKVMTQNIKQ